MAGVLCQEISGEQIIQRAAVWTCVLLDPQEILDRRYVVAVHTGGDIELTQLRLHLAGDLVGRRQECLDIKVS
jgi:hypothetical protein